MVGSWITRGALSARGAEADLDELLDQWSDILNSQVDFSYAPATDRDGRIVCAATR